MTWLNKQDLTRLWQIAQKLAEFDFKKASDEEKLNNYLDRLSCRDLLPSYAYSAGIGKIQGVVEQQFQKPLTQKLKRAIITWCERRARESAKENLQYPKVSANSNLRSKIQAKRRTTQNL